MTEGRISVLAIIADHYLKNPFFILDSSGEKDPLLHQTETLARCFFLKPTRVLIADVIGLGKTITALRIMEMLRIYDNASKILIIIPSILLPQWIEELKSFGIIPTIITKDKLKELNKYTALPPGIYIGSLDRLKKEEYFKLIERENWDLIIVDEAQKVGFVGGKPNLRWRVLGHYIARYKNVNVVLLSATPHKGYDYDYLARLYIVDPSLASLGPPQALKRVARSLDASFYTATHNVIVHRRTKSDINDVYEGRKVFKDCYMLALLVKPSSFEEEMLSNLIKAGEKGLANYYHELALKGHIDPAKVSGVIKLLRKLIVKRGLSSPRALVETFSKIVKKRKDILSALKEKGLELEEAKRIVEERIPEFERKLEKVLDPEAELEEEEESVEPDSVFNEVADAVADLLPSKYVEQVGKAVEIAKKIIDGEYRDSKIEALKQLIDETFREHEGKFKDLHGAKVVVFTEFKDTAEYVHSKLKEWLREKYGEKADDMIRLITSENRSKYEKVAEWFRKNQHAKILVTTDVLGEGLNLQVANVLVNYEITYSPIRLEQRIGRVWRYGQGRNCYIFNLFYIHRYEKEVADIIFGKLYGITEAVGKQELTLGDEVYISAVGDSLFEKTIKERLGKEYEGYSKYLSGLIPLSFKHKGREVKLTESEVIEAGFEGELEDYVEEFIKSIVELARMIREKSIFPEPLSRADIEQFLFQSFGIKNNEEAYHIATKLRELYEEISGSKIKSAFTKEHPDIILKEVRSRFMYSSVGEDKATVFVLPSEDKKLFILALATVKIENEALGGVQNARFYKEPILVELDAGKKAEVHRGEKLVELLSKILPYALEVDEHYGLEDLLANEWSRVKGYALSRFQNNYSGLYNDLVKRIKGYEDKKANVGASNFFKCRVSVAEVRPLCYFASVGLLPESRARSETGVWLGFENQYLKDVVLNYERMNERTANIRKREEEHYDVYSYGEDEERFIEVKGFVKPRLDIRLTEKEYEKAKELGDKYWLYLVYGVGNEKPVLLCIRDPARRIELTRIETTVVRREYVWSRKLTL